MATKPQPAKLPRDLRDPVGLDALEKKAMQDFSARLNRISRAYKDALEQIPVELAVNAKYTFLLDGYLLSSLMANLDTFVDSILLEGGERSLWFAESYVAVAAARGIAQEHANLSAQSPAYKAGRGTVQDILRSEPHRRRMALVYAREFEEMKGLSGDVKARLGAALTDGIGRGLNPREIAKNITEATGKIKSKRANTIARTEITTALRRARWDEAEDANQEYGLRTKELHLSALAATTRRTHSQRHGKLFTIEEVREWWAKDANSINCRCTTTSVMVDKDGNPLVPSIIDRAKRAKDNMEKRGYEWSKSDD